MKCKLHTFQQWLNWWTGSKIRLLITVPETGSIPDRRWERERERHACITCSLQIDLQSIAKKRYIIINHVIWTLWSTLPHRFGQLHFYVEIFAIVAVRFIRFDMIFKCSRHHQQIGVVVCSWSDVLLRLTRLIRLNIGEWRAMSEAEMGNS